MRYILALLLLSAPFVATATGIYSNTSASSNSGGNYAGPGGTVVEGESSASVHTTNTGATGSNSSTIYIKTNANGQVHEEVIQGEGEVGVAVEATPIKTEVKVKKDGEPAKVITTVATTSASTSIALAAEPVPAPTLVAQIFSWVRGLFSFWL